MTQMTHFGGWAADWLPFNAWLVDLWSATFGELHERHGHTTSMYAGQANDVDGVDVVAKPTTINLFIGRRGDPDHVEEFGDTHEMDMEQIEAEIKSFIERHLNSRPTSLTTALVRLTAHRYNDTEVRTEQEYAGRGLIEATFTRQAPQQQAHMLNLTELGGPSAPPSAAATDIHAQARAVERIAMGAEPNEPDMPLDEDSDERPRMPTLDDIPVQPTQPAAAARVIAVTPPAPAVAPRPQPPAPQARPMPEPTQAPATRELVQRSVQPPAPRALPNLDDVDVGDGSPDAVFGAFAGIPGADPGMKLVAMFAGAMIRQQGELLAREQRRADAREDRESTRLDSLLARLETAATTQGQNWKDIATSHADTTRALSRDLRDTRARISDAEMNAQRAQTAAEQETLKAQIQALKDDRKRLEDAIERAANAPVQHRAPSTSVKDDMAGRLVNRMDSLLGRVEGKVADEVMGGGDAFAMLDKASPDQVAELLLGKLTPDKMAAIMTAIGKKNPKVGVGLADAVVAGVESAPEQPKNDGGGE